MTPTNPSENPTYFAPVFVSATMGPAPSLGEGRQAGFSQGAILQVSPVGGPEQSS